MRVYILQKIENLNPAVPFSAHASEQGANERLLLEREGHQAKNNGDFVYFVYFIGPFPLELED